MGTLTNNQAAYRLPQYHAAFIHGLNERACNLYADGYEVSEQDEDSTTFLLWQATLETALKQKPGRSIHTAYRVDPVAGTCTCRFMTDQPDHPLREDGGIVPCKHLRGLDGLVKSLLDYWQQAVQVEEKEHLRVMWQERYDALRAAWQRTDTARQAGQEETESFAAWCERVDACESRPTSQQKLTWAEKQAIARWEETDWADRLYEEARDAALFRRW